MRSASTSWLVYPRPNPLAIQRLFCLPYAGGGASFFRDWSEYLPQNTEVGCIQLPGRENRLHETAITESTPLVHTIADVLQVHLDKPYTLFGHSMGALLVFQLARELRRRAALMPECLFVSGSGAAQIPIERTPIHNLQTPEFLEALRSYAGTPNEVLENTELIELLLPLLRADFSVCETYVYKDEPPLDVPLCVFGGLKDDISRERLEAWCQQTNRACSVRMLPGDHFFVQTARPLLLQILSQELSRIAIHTSQWQ